MILENGFSRKDTKTQSAAAFPTVFFASLRPCVRNILLAITTLLVAYGYAHSMQTDDGSKLSSIKGRVLSDGQPVTNASVTVSSVSSARQTRAVPTNENGDFEVKGLETGVYRVQVRSPAYVSLPADPDQDIYRTGDSITLNMTKGGVITGKIVTANNDPVVAVRVRALMIRDLNGRRPSQAEPSADRLTDDRGVYRIFGLTPGTYVVFAGGRGFSGTGANAYDNDAPTFASSSTRDTAEEISLGSGEERTIDIRYRASSGHAVSGNVNVAGTPNSAWLQINLVRIISSKLDFSVSTFQNARTKGFEFHGVADGEYLIWSSYNATSGETLLSEPKRITVKGTDVAGIELIPKALASVAGVVVLEPSTMAECKDKRRPLFDETLLSLQRNHRRTQGPAKEQPLELPSYGSSRASPDAAGSFQLRNLAAGQYNFNIRIFAKYWYLRSVTVPGPKDSPASDLAKNFLILKSGDRVTGLKATLTEGAASISGQVELPEERRSGRIVFYLVPAEKDKADEVLRYFEAPVADDGSFTLDHVPPGHYWTLAKFVPTENETNALRLSSEAAARVRLKREAEAAKSDVELKPCQSVRNHHLAVVSN
jgi:hypothetical protein